MDDEQILEAEESVIAEELPKDDNLENKLNHDDHIKSEDEHKAKEGKDLETIDFDELEIEDIDGLEHEVK